ncbi:MAG: nuclear transport factor 2 family protein [Corynebacterium sp.]|uniref:nuclear transport factor 2 family protein n=1 Tax=Corynebacterium sp. TaxID=1720 RepID=UPI0026E075AF|nr:nuclear transport factor 2 family protein [Corynebacterium sp.]MDO5669199.1 nuclear transport factor 2 family protein [Corynebacterium sp.]
MTPTTISRWIEADRTGDLAGMRACLAADARLISPLTDGFSFQGAEEVMAVFAAAFELLDDITIHRTTGADADWVIYGTNRLGAQNLEEIQWLRLNNEGLIAEITLFIRPMPAAVMLLGRIGPGLATRGALLPAAKVASTAARPLGWIVRLVEQFLMPRLR